MTTAHGHDAIDAGRSSTGRASRGIAGFTLIEMLAVMAIIAVLVGIMVVIVGYVQRQLAVATAKSQIAAICAATENYKSDVGYYPVSLTTRISADGIAAASNNRLLYRALCGLATGKKYMNFIPSLVRTNTTVPMTISGTTTSACFGLFDPWGFPYVYYCSPNTPLSVSNGLPAGWVCDNNNCSNWYGGRVLGGQVNVGSFDLMSFGPDQSTYVPGAVAFNFGGNTCDYAWYYGVLGGRYTNTAASFDDIANFRR